jgi:aldehyde dehydrogenase (NAD+)
MIEHKNIYVDGQWIPSISSGVLTVINPVTEEPIANLPRGGAEDVDKAAQAAARAFPAWSQTSPEYRAGIFRKMARLTEARTEELTRTIVSELGYPISYARPAHIGGGVEELDLIADVLGEIEWVEDIGTTRLERVPSGVLGAITAWNGPFRSVISKAGAAMAAGCTVVLKPSEVAPLTAIAFAELAEEAGLPPGVFNLVFGTGPEVGEAIVNHPLVDMVSITGSVRAGKRVMELASAAVKRVHLELGGKSANIIFDDVDFEKAVSDGIVDAMRNTGQACGALTRVLVQEDRLQEAEALAVRKCESFVFGDPFDPATTLGPVANAAAHQRVRGYIELGMKEGLKLLTGGLDMPPNLNRGFYVRPTVFSGDNSSRLAQEEIFGPVILLIPYKDEEDALRIANDTVYGLAAGVWSADKERAHRVASKLRTGRVRINGAALDKRGVHGGFKLSGVGREWGRVGVEEFLEYRAYYGW